MKTNHLNRSKKRKSSRQMSRRTTSSRRIKMKQKTKKNRSRAKIMRMKNVLHSIISLTSRSMKKKALFLQRRSVRSSIRRRRNQIFRSILVEVRVCRLVRLKRINSRFLTMMKTLIHLKKKNDRFLTKVKTLIRHSNVVVISTFNRFV
jgi:hypothetical protein